MDDKRTGKGVYTWPNGNRYEGDFVNSAFSGFGIYYGPKIDRAYSELGDLTAYNSSAGPVIIGLWRNDKIYERYAYAQECWSKIECEQTKARALFEIEEYKNKIAAEQKAWEAELNGKDPQAMYLKAGTLLRNGNTSKGAELYEAIIRRFPNSQWAVKASDQLSTKNGSDKVEQANRDASNRAACFSDVRKCESQCSFSRNKSWCVADCQRQCQ